MQDTQINCPPQRKFYTSADLVLLVVLAACLCFTFIVYRDAGQQVAIYGQGASWQLPLVGPKKRVAVPGPLGKTIVEVGEGTAAIVSSPCPDGICIKSGRISQTGQAIICAPNLVTVKVLGKGDYHALTY